MGNAVRISILMAVKLFYAIDALRYYASTPKRELFRKSHERWYNDLVEYQEEYNAKLARAIFDYTVAVCLGEARHAASRTKNTLKNFPFSPSNSRDYVLKSANDWEPFSALRACALLFGPDVSWESGYGGLKWEAIAKAGLMYKTCPDSVFIDHCVDLSHNNNSYFDKGYIFDLTRDEYTNFLNCKRDSSIEVSYFVSQGTGKRFTDLFHRGQALGIVPTMDFCRGLPIDVVLKYDWDLTEDRVLKYNPRDYENKALPAELARSSMQRCYNCGSLHRTEYMQRIGGYWYCCECYFACDECGEISVGRSYYYHDEYVCESCYDNLRFEDRQKAKRAARARAQIKGAAERVYETPKDKILRLDF